jgi:hypothetical protein
MSIFSISAKVQNKTRFDFHFFSSDERSIQMEKFVQTLFCSLSRAQNSVKQIYRLGTEKLACQSDRSKDARNQCKSAK